MTVTAHVEWRPAATVKDWATMTMWRRGSELPSWHSVVLERALKVQHEMGTSGPSDVAIKEMMVLLSRSMWPDTIPPSVVGTFDNGVQLEWHAHGVDLEVRIEHDGSTSGWCDRAGFEAWDSDQGVNAGRLKKELSALKAHV